MYVFRGLCSDTVLCKLKIVACFLRGTRYDERLFDVPTRMRNNVSGRGKEKLDPDIMAYIKAEVFEYYECI